MFSYRIGVNYYQSYVGNKNQKITTVILYDKFKYQEVFNSRSRRIDTNEKKLFCALIAN